MAKSYKIRRFQNGRSSTGKAFWNYSITIPTEIAQKLPTDMQYVCKIDDKGIHFTPAESAEEDVKLPAWAQKRPAANGAPKPKRAGSRPKPGVKSEA